MTRWLLRCCDTIKNHNNPRYGRDMITAVQQDKNKWLKLACEMGEDKSLSARLKASARVRPMEKLPHIFEGDEELMKAQHLNIDAIQSTKELLSQKIFNEIEVFCMHRTMGG